MYIDYLQDNFSPSSADARVHWTKVPGAPDADSKPFTTAGMGDYHAVRTTSERSSIHCSESTSMSLSYVMRGKPSFMDKHRDIRAALPGKTLAMVAQSVDFISHMIEDDGKRTVNFKPSAREDAGSRFRYLHGQVISADDLPKIYTKWDGK